MTKEKTTKPLKRHPALQPLSREHHHGLLLSWKIRAGLNNKTEADRIKKYCDIFFKYQLLPHFEMEENHFFTVLGNDNELVKQAVEQHRQLEMFFNKPTPTVETLKTIAELLDAHIRFEERILFNKIQEAATPQELIRLAELHPEQMPVCKAVDEWKDEFWT